MSILNPQKKLKLSQLWLIALTYLLIDIPIIAQTTTDYPFKSSIIQKDNNRATNSFNSLCNNSRFRTIDGSCNNLSNRSWGATNTPFERNASADYLFDGNTMIDRGNPRMISNVVCHQENSIPSREELSVFVFSFLQFIDHDIIATVAGDTEFEPIIVPMEDFYLDPFNTGNQMIPFMRSAVLEGSGTSGFNPRQQINAITSWLDASGVYGSDEERAAWLRSYSYGKLKTFNSPHGELLPCNTTTGDCNDPIDEDAPEMDSNKDHCGNYVKVFVAGDVRANEQPGLTALHTLFVREHNRICEERVNAGFTNDEDNYQYARRLVGATIQAITFNEVLPAMGLRLRSYNGYKSWVNPSIMNSFSTAAFRLGHTMVTSDLQWLEGNCYTASLTSGCGSGTEGVFDGESICGNSCGRTFIDSPVALRSAFFNPSLIANNGIEGLFQGMASQTQEEIDAAVVDDVRNFLFGNLGEGGLDLAALNIQRGRDHGLKSYNQIRASFGLPMITQFYQINTRPNIYKALEKAYGQVRHIDAWVGMLAEEPRPGKKLGETLHELLKSQFEKIRDGDRFWFERDESIPTDLKNTIKETTLADVINRNTYDLDLDEVFKAKPCEGRFAFNSIQPGSNLNQNNNQFILTAYPIPASNNLVVNINSPVASNAQIQLINIVGELTFTKAIELTSGFNEFDLPIQDLANGIYILKVQGKTTNKHIKIEILK